MMFTETSSNLHSQVLIKLPGTLITAKKVYQVSPFFYQTTVGALKEGVLDSSAPAVIYIGTAG